ncbi:hypothetical protein [Candidatus Poriferisodalis sp.]|uniref:hypothetical protein n=1 Tax=Candidatus Poriferisodalis sp. TaxID=3101277 RepID=UPI003B02C2A7
MVFWSEALREQDGMGGLDTGGVCDQLAEVVVVCPSEHVLDDDTAVSVGVVEHEIGAIAADRHLAVLQGEIQAETVADDLRVISEPWRQVVCLVGPEFANRNGLNPRDALRQFL